MSNSKKRPTHLRSAKGGNNTKCGRGGITFSAPIADDPTEATCQQCLHTHDVAQRANSRAR